MVAVALCAALLIQNPHLKVWKGSPPKKEWPLFDGHQPIAPPKLSGIRSWVYSFPGKFDGVVQELRKSTGDRFTEFDPNYLEPRIDWDSFDRATEFSTGAVTVDYLIYDHSYTVLENCKIRPLKAFYLIDDKTAKEAKGWVTVIINEPNPEVWQSKGPPVFRAARSWSNDERLPLPQQANWPMFFDNKPFAVIDSGGGDVRYWYYTFQANWDDVIRLTKNDLGKRGYAWISGAVPLHGGDGRYTADKEITFRRGGLLIISIVLADDSYTLYKDARGSGPPGSATSHSSPSPGWLFVIRAEPVSGPNLKFAERADKSGVGPFAKKRTGY